MKIVVTAQGTDIDSLTSPIFGRCPAFVVVDSDTMEFRGTENAGAAAGGGAGIQAAQWVIEQGVEGLLSYNVGPNAFAVLEQAGVPVYRIEGGTVREVVQALNENKLEVVSGPNVASKSGMSRRGGF